MKMTEMPPLEVWFDGSCGLCQASVAWARRRDVARRLRFRDASSESEAGEAPVTAQELGSAMWVRRPDGSLAGGFAGVRAVLAELPRWRWLARLLAAPPFRWLGPPAYRLVARYRHRLPLRAFVLACDPTRPDEPC